MAKKKDYIPSSDDALVGWHDRLKTAATAIGATLGIAADDLTEIGTDNTAIHTDVSAAATATAATQKIVSRRKPAGCVIAWKTTSLLSGRLPAIRPFFASKAKPPVNVPSLTSAQNVGSRS
jgi:hypothetical protein